MRKTSISDVAAAKFNMAAAISEVFFSLVPVAVSSLDSGSMAITGFSASINSLGAQSVMLLLRVMFIFNMSAAKLEVVLQVRHVYFRLLVDVEAHQPCSVEAGKAENAGAVEVSTVRAICLT
jgi:hypothetical protein